MKISLILSAFLLVLISCKQEAAKSNSFNQSEFKFISKINLNENPNELEIISGGKSISFRNDELPLKTAMVIPTSAIAYLDELNLTYKITGISQPDFIYNSKIQSKIQNKQIEIIGTFDEIFVEKILVNKPDIFISTSSPTLAKYHDLIQKEGIKILYIDEYEELNPLAKAEYVKIFGKLFGKEKEANELFDEIKKNYNEIKSKVQQNQAKNPTVFANQIYGDTWYMPGGKSFQAKLFEDAGANYLWNSDDSFGTLNLSFESVFEKANNAEIWMNAGDFADKKSLLASYENYDWFAAFKSGKVYNWNNKITPKGANDYFETGTARPDWVLKDLAAIFHPELFPEYELYFYKKLE
ncbi:MAG TPA: ABC transporter substrate-binding protein [Moheibacter sp.]|nr:ABC transporter substrate-binding protein [Moheibacter sp.]